MINCTFIFQATNVFSCFRSIITQFKLVKYKFLNSTIFYINLYSFQITCSVKQYIICQYTQLPRYYQTTAGTFYNLNCFGHVPKYCKTFDSPEYFLSELFLKQTFLSFPEEVILDEERKKDDGTISDEDKLRIIEGKHIWFLRKFLFVLLLRDLFLFVLVSNSIEYHVKIFFIIV